MDPKNTNPDQPANPNLNTAIPTNKTNLLANSLPQVTPTQTSPLAQTQQPPTPPVAPKKLSKKLFIIPIFFILILLILTAIPLTLAYNNYKLITPPQNVQNLIDEFIAISPLPKTPRIILAKAENNIANIKSANIENVFEISTDDKTAPIKSASLTLNGPVDFKTQNVSKVSLDISGSVSMEGLQLSGSGSIRKIQNNLYFKINEFPAASILPIAQFKNQWFFVNIDQLQGKKENDTNKIFQDLKTVFAKYAQKSADWSQKTEDKSNFNLKIKPPKEEINNLLFDILDTVQTDTSTNLEKNIQKDNLKKFTDKLENFEINVIVDKKTYMVSEVNLQSNLTIQAPSTQKQSGTINLSPANQTPVKFKITSKFTKYNEPVIVEIPEGAKDLKEAVNQIMKSLPKGEKLPTNPFTSPTESTPQAKPKDQTGFKNLLNNTSPVLGTQNTNWDKILLDYFSGII